MTRSQFRIQRLQTSDVATLRQLNALFAEAFEDHESYGRAPPDDAYVQRLLGSDTIVALVALDGDTVIGGITAYELPKFEQARSELYLYDLAVAEGHRRRGVATSLIAELRAIAADRGAWVVFVQADLGDEPAISLYEKLGVREEVLHFDMEVGRRP